MIILRAHPFHHSTGMSEEIEFSIILENSQLTQILHQHLPPVFGRTILVQQGFECVVLKLVGQTLCQCLQGPVVLRQTMIAADEMFEQPMGWLFRKLDDHFSLNKQKKN